MRAKRIPRRLGRMQVMSKVPNIVKAEGEELSFKVGDDIKIAKRSPIRHFRVPNYVHGKRGPIEAVI